MNETSARQKTDGIHRPVVKGIQCSGLRLSNVITTIVLQKGQSTQPTLPFLSPDDYQLVAAKIHPSTKLNEFRNNNWS